MAYTPQAPNKEHVVRDVAARFPALFADAGHGSTVFVTRVVQELSQTDGSWRLVGIDGDPNRLSEDAIGYIIGGSPLHDPRTGVPCEVIDIISSSTAPPGSPGREVQWLDQTEASLSRPPTMVAPPPLPVDPPPPSGPPPGMEDPNAYITEWGYDAARAFFGPQHASRLITALTSEWLDRRPMDSPDDNAIRTGLLRMQTEYDKYPTPAHAAYDFGPSTGPRPLPPAGNLSQLPGFRGNFQYEYNGAAQSDYIASGFAMRTDAEIDQRISWLRSHSYNVELLNLTQWQWVRPPGGDIYTRNTRNAPVVEAARPGIYENRPVVGWRHDTDEYLRVVERYRRAGIEVVLGLFEYPTMSNDADRDEAISAIPRLGAALDPHVVGVQCFWEGDEVMDISQMRDITRRVGAAFPTCTVGPHFASGTPSYLRQFFAGDTGCNGYFHQYVDKGAGTTPGTLAYETHSVINALPSNVLLVAHEHTQSRAEGFSHAQSRERAQACLIAGAAGSLNG